MDRMSRSISFDIHKTPSRRIGGAALAAFLAVAASVWVLFGRGGSIPADMESIRREIVAGRLDRAEAGLVRLLARSPHDDTAWLMLGGTRRIAGRPVEARAAFDRVKGPGPAWTEARTQVAEILIQDRQAAGAEDVLREVVARDPRAVEARRRMAYLLVLEAREEEARAVLRELYHLDPDARHLVTMVGLRADDSGGRDQSRELLDFLEKTPGDSILRRARGLGLLRLGKPAEARPLLEAAAPAIEDDPIGRVALAECRLATGDLAGVDAALGPEPAPGPERARWRLIRGQVEESRGSIDLAIAEYRKALDANPDDRVVLYRLGQALVRRGRGDEGQPLMARAEAVRIRGITLVLEIDRCLRGGVDPGLFEQIAGLCRDSGLMAEARGWFEQSIRLDPTRTLAQAELAKIAEPPPSTPIALRRKSAGPSTVRIGVAAASSSAMVRFEDIADRAGLAFRYNAWPTGNLFLGDTMGGGVGLFDYDEDGRLDVYFVDGCRLPIAPGEDPAPNKLFRNKGDGTFEDVTARAGVGGHGYGMGCVVGDYDGDGHDDLFVTGLGRAVLYRNKGDGTFEDATARARVGSDRWTTAAGFGDLDGDGDLDLMVVTYVEADPRNVPECLDPTGRPFHCPPGQFRPQFDQLFRNDGDGTFTDVSREAGLEVPGGLGLGLAIADFDDDGKLDLFVANDAAPNFLFRNLGGLKFEEVGVPAGAAYDGNGRATASMGVVADDLDGDSRIDLFHVNFLNEANTLLRNLGGGQFDDVTRAAGLDANGRATTGFGAVAIDVENDGRLDLFVANGHVDDRPWADHPMAQRPSLYRSRAPGRFELAPASIAPYFARPAVGRGAAAGDLDNDGRVDLVVVHRDTPAAVLRNLSEAGHWIGLRLVGEKSGKTPVGARITCLAGGRTSTRWLTSGTSYLGSNDPRIWFGLGGAAKVDRLEVRWPSGLVQSWSDLPADRILRLVEGRDPVALREISGPGQSNLRRAGRTSYPGTIDTIETTIGRDTVATRGPEARKPAGPGIAPEKRDVRDDFRPDFEPLEGE